MNLDKATRKDRSRRGFQIREDIDAESLVDPDAMEVLDNEVVADLEEAIMSSGSLPGLA